jgi:hypothetical protein
VADSARFVVDVDALGLGQQGSGTRLATEATIDDLPDALRVDIGSLGPGRSPLDVTWRADAPIAISGGTLDLRNGGGAHFELHGAFEVGAAGADPLPPAGRIQVTRSNSADRRNEVLYSSPDAPADGFPTPDVPGYDPDDRVRLHVGAELSQDQDRAAGVATRVHADLQVPQPIEVVWETTADGRIKTVQGGYECDPGNQSEVTCQAGRYDVAVVRGPRGDLGPAALLTRPALPVPTGVVAQAVPAFTEFRPASGARAVVLGPDAWGAEALISGLARFTYQREQSVVRVTLADTAAQPFRLNLLDASRTADTGFGPRPQVLFADAALSQLPRSVTVRQRDATADPEDPWLWINTEGSGIRDIEDVDWTTDPAGDRPRLTGVLRLGDAVALRDRLPFAERPTPPRPATASGADVWADYDDDTHLLSADAAVSLEVPRHVAVWRPAQRFCDGTTDDPEGCDYGPSYELDETNHVDARFRTTSARLGDLNLTGALRSGFHFEPCGLGCFRPAWTTHWTARARVADVPGRLRVQATIADNVRLPWLEVDLDIEANVSTDQVWAAVADENAEVEYREDGSPIDEQCTETGDQCTSRYAVQLDDVPASFRVTGRVQGYAEERLTPPPPSDEPPDPDEPETDLGGVGFVHAQLDLHGTTNRVFVDGREAADGQFVGSLRAERPDDGDDGDGDPEPGLVSGFVNARLEHVTVDLDRRSAPEAHPFSDYFFDRGGMVGLGVCRLAGDDEGGCEDEAPVIGAFGRMILPMFLGLDLVVGGLLQIFFDGDVTREFDLEMDLPVYLGFDRIDQLRVGQSGSTVGVDEHHPGAGAPATVAVRQRSLSFEPALQVDGAYFHHRHVEFSYDPLIPLEDFDIGGDITDALADVGLYRHDDCEEGERCYDVDRGSNVVTLDEVASPPDEARPGFDSADIMLDPLFSPEDREQFEDDDGGVVHPDDIFPRIAAASPPVPAEAFAPLPELSHDLVERRPGFFDQTTTCCFDALFQTNRPDNPAPILETFGAVCAVSDPEAVLDGPRAVGSDGTEYVVVRKASNEVPANRDRTLCDATQLLLEAHFPGPGNDLGPPRWTIALPLPAGMGDRPGRDDDGVCRREEDVRCEIEVRVAPQAGGSVQVEMTTRVIADGTDSRAQDFTITMNPDAWAQQLLRLREVLLVGCCGEPEVITHASSALDPVFAWVDASGHPGFHRGEAVQVDDLDEVVVPIDQATGVAELDPCEIAPDFGCDGVPAGHTTRWLFGDGRITEPVGGQPAFRTHTYPRGTPNPDIFLGMLVHLDEHGEVVETAQFRPAGA